MSTRAEVLIQAPQMAEPAATKVTSVATAIPCCLSSDSVASRFPLTGIGNEAFGDNVVSIETTNNVIDLLTVEPRLAAP
jgi:hypothetical protein